MAQDPMIILAKLENGEQKEMTVDEFVTLDNAEFVRTIRNGNFADFEKMMQKAFSKSLS